jgi:hypothetical protein
VQVECASFSVQVAVDDKITSAELNGINLELPEHQTYSSVSELTAAAHAGLFIVGMNVLRVNVSNAHGGAGGLYLEGDLVLDCTPPPSPPPYPPPPPSLENCGLDPLICVFFDAECLANVPNGTDKVGAFMDAITHGFNVDNMIGAFVSGFGLFTIARLGGIPVPSTFWGVFLWIFVRPPPFL